MIVFIAFALGIYKMMDLASRMIGKGKDVLTAQAMLGICIFGGVMYGAAAYGILNFVQMLLTQ